MTTLQKLMRAIEELGVEDLDTLREFLDWRREELLNASPPLAHEQTPIGIEAICASIKQTRSTMSKDQIKEIKWTTSMLYLKEESKGLLD
jgi:hypothetical protein